MATPSVKAPTIDRLLDTLVGASARNHRSNCIERDVCTFCGADASPDSFDSDLSRKEFSISGLCQKCQDAVFD